MPDHINISDYRVQTAGNVELSAGGDHFTVYAVGLGALLSMRAQGSVIVGAGDALLTLDAGMPGEGCAILQAGVMGTVKIGCGPPVVGAQMIFEPEEITISLGPPGAGASIKITPISIKFQVAETSFEMTPLGITEELATSKRELNPMGHTLAAAESTAAVQVQGVSLAGPLIQTKADAMGQFQQTLGKIASDAMMQETAAIRMIG